VGRAVKWWFPARFFGMTHTNRAREQWQHSHPEGDPCQWKRAQDDRRKREPDAGA